MFKILFRLTASKRKLRSLRVPPVRALSSLPKPDTLSYLNGLSTEPLRGITIGNQLEKAVAKTPDRTALVFSSLNRRYTFSELYKEVDACAAGLLALGVKPGDRVGVWGPNLPEWIFLQFGTARVGAIMVSVNPLYRAHELEFVLNKTGCSVLVLGETFHHQNFYALVSQLAPELSKMSIGSQSSLKAARLPHLKHLVSMGSTGKPGAITYRDMVNSSTAQLLTEVKDLQPKLKFDDPINIQFTSGTTGLPKGATLTHHGLVNNCFFAGFRMGYHKMQKTVICSPVPFYHNFGMVGSNMMLLLHNVTIVIPTPAYNGEATFRSVLAERCTTLYGTPTMFVDVLAARQRALNGGEKIDLSCLYNGIIAGASVPPALLSELMEKLHMPQCRIAYGSTELSPLLTMSMEDDTIDERTRTVGYLMEHTEVKIMNPATGQTVPLGEQGEVCSRGYNTMLGYWNEPEKTNETITRDHWYRTGDLGLMRATGHVEIVGRIKDMINRGGEKVWPAEVESFLVTHPNVAEAYLVGVPDPRLGEEVCAYIKLKNPSKSTSAKEIIDFCKGTIAYFKIPKHILFTTEFPLTVTGKVQKFMLRERALKDLKLKP